MDNYPVPGVRRNTRRARHCRIFLLRLTLPSTIHSHATSLGFPCVFTVHATNLVDVTHTEPETPHALQELPPHTYHPTRLPTFLQLIYFTTPHHTQDHTRLICRSTFPTPWDGDIYYRCEQLLIGFHYRRFSSFVDTTHTPYSNSPFSGSTPAFIPAHTGCHTTPHILPSAHMVTHTYTQFYALAETFTLYIHTLPTLLPPFSASFCSILCLVRSPLPMVIFAAPHAPAGYSRAISRHAHGRVDGVPPLILLPRTTLLLPYDFRLAATALLLHCQYLLPIRALLQFYLSSSRR